MRKLMLFTVFAMLGAASAQACPNIKGDDFVCEGEFSDMFAGMEVKDGALHWEGQVFSLNGQVFTDQDGISSSGTCQGNTITRRDTYNGLRAEQTITLNGNEIRVVGTNLVGECVGGPNDCDKPGAVYTFSVEPIDTTCRRK